MKLWPLLIGLALCSAARADAPRRIALLAGSNAASPGRKALRYAHKDAERLGEVLRRMGGFTSEDVRVLLEPEPAALLAELRRAQSALSKDGLLLFYYSGHADESALYPGGERLRLEDLKAALEASPAAVRVGIIDACRGGGWTQAKGLSAGPAFEVHPPLELGSEGSALISASSGLEDAHEAESLEGSFFTHHFVAGLVGAADQSGDGEVSLAEVFDYARGLTIRDTALVAQGPQHPSFQTRLRGRQDVVLTRLAQTGVLILEQRKGPLELLQLPSGARLLELPSGAKEVRLAVPPGRYLVVARQTVGSSSREVSVGQQGSTRVSEDSLLPATSTTLASKRFEGIVPSLASTLPSGKVEARVGAGVFHMDQETLVQGFDPYTGVSADTYAVAYERRTVPAARLSLSVGITDRFQWSAPLPTFAYRFGKDGGREWIVWGGVLHWQLTTKDFSYQLGAGLDVRHWLSSAHSFQLGVRTKSGGARNFDGTGRLSPDTWIAEAVGGYSYTIAQIVTLNLSLAVATNVTYQGRFPRRGALMDEQGTGIGIGSVMERGLRSVPFVSVQLSQALTLDLYASLRRKFLSGDFYETYLLGFSWTM